VSMPNKLTRASYTTIELRVRLRQKCPEEPWHISVAFLDPPQALPAARALICESCLEVVEVLQGVRCTGGHANANADVSARQQGIAHAKYVIVSACLCERGRAGPRDEACTCQFFTVLGWMDGWQKRSKASVPQQPSAAPHARTRATCRRHRSANSRCLRLTDV